MSNKDSYKVGEGLYRSLINDVSLLEFTSLCLFFCGANHRNCQECRKRLNCANDILHYGVIDVKTVYCKHFPETKYISNKAVRRLMQLPVVVFTLTLQGPGSQRLFVTENKPYVDFSLFVSWFPKVIPTDQIKKGVTRDQLQAICSLASSEKDRKLIRFAACKAQGLSSKKARKEYGIHCLGKLNEEVEDALSQAEELRKAVNTLANVEEKATLQALGINVEDSECSDEESEGECIMQESSGDENEDDGLMEASKVQRKTDSLPRSRAAVCEQVPGLPDPDTLLKRQSLVSPIPSVETLVSILRENNLNWFTFVGELQLLLVNYMPEVLHQALLDFAHNLSNTDLTDEEEQKVEQSRQAFLAMQREVGAADEEEVGTSSESDNPDDWVGVQDVLSEKGKELVIKQRKIFQRKKRRQLAKD